MGVLACDRLGCDNIMCDHYSDEHGYICWECLRELKEKGFCDIGSFMHSTKEVRYPEEDWDDHLDHVFKSRWEDDES